MHYNLFNSNRLNMSNFTLWLFILAAVTLQETVLCQQMFAEKWFMKHPHYDREGSTCQVDADCDAPGKQKFREDPVDGTKEKIEQRCALVEIYVATSISISEFVEPTRSL